MRKSILLFFFIICAFGALAQSDEPSLNELNRQRINHTKTGMIILGSWAIGNILVSPVLAGRANGSQRYFHQMNVYWNVINLGIAGIGYWGLLRENPDALSFSSSLLEQQKIEKLLLFNTGLDVAYVLGGLYMKERAGQSSRQRERLKGFGKSIMIQGGFLFVFDLLFYLKMNHHGKGIYKLLDNIHLTPNSIGLLFEL